MFDVKIIFAFLATILLFVGYYPYLKDLFARRTQPHLYTWLIWAITASIATAGVLTGGGSLGAIPMVVGTGSILLMCLLSIWYGSKNITKSDTFTLIAALVAILIWVQLDNPLLAVLLATAIDGFGYIPTFRKSYVEPFTETPFFWLVMSGNSFLTILALDAYNLLTTAYLVVIGVANLALYFLILYRRKKLSK